MRNIDILQAMRDPELFGSMFKPRMFRKDSWRAWRAFLAALFALPLEGDALETYRRHTARSDAPIAAFSECWCVCGRRSGKSVIAAAVATYLAAFKDYSAFRAPGETLVLPVIAPDRRQCRTILGYIGGFFDSSPVLSALVANRLKEAVELTNGVRIEVHTANFRTVRGYTAVGAVVDEAAFLRSEDSATPDTELLAALMPSMATIPGALLLAISSPYARRGELWRAFKQHYGRDDSDVLVWKATSREMNPTLSQRVVDAALARDRAAASSEYLAEFRSDLESFISTEAVEACVVPGRRELPPIPGVSYYAFTDPSGGSSDSFTLGIAHVERNVAVLDAIREVVPPFSPEQVVEEYSAVLKKYGCWNVVGDRYAGSWPSEQYAKRNVTYHPAEQTKSELYLTLLAAVNSGHVALLDDKKLIAQLCSLERKTGRTADFVDHPPGMHDDVANAVAGALVAAFSSVTSDVLGLLDYDRAVASGKIIESPTRLQPAPKPEEPPAPCPSCKWPHTTDLGHAAQRLCTACGCQFVAGESPEIVVPSHSNLHLFQGTKTVTNPRAFNRARSFWSFLDRRR
jgi:hypothetical protein